MSAGDWKELFQAVENGNYSLSEYHVKSGVNLNYQHPEILMTVLVTAIRLGHHKIVELLLEHGADLELESYFDQLTPLQAALKYKNKEALFQLKKRNVKISFLQKMRIAIFLKNE